MIKSVFPHYFPILTLAGAKCQKNHHDSEMRDVPKEFCRPEQYQSGDKNMASEKTVNLVSRPKIRSNLKRFNNAGGKHEPIIGIIPKAQHLHKIPIVSMQKLSPGLA